MKQKINKKEFEVRQRIFTYTIIAERLKYSNHAGSMWEINIYNKLEFPHHGAAKNYFLIRLDNMVEVTRFVKFIQKLLDNTPSPYRINEALTINWLFDTLKNSKICLYGFEI